MSPLRLALITGAVAALVGCSALVSADDLSNGNSPLAAAGKATADGGGATSDDSDAGSTTTAPADDNGSTDTTTTTTDGDADAADAGDVDGGSSSSSGGTDDGGTASTDSCVGKQDGFGYKAGSPVDRCCGGQPVKMSATNNCGSCGIQCPAGFACGEVTAGKWGCRCATDVSCQTAGYGAGATCYNDGTNAFCNCQCPGGAVTCNSLCKGGSVCHDDVGQNYCSY